MINYDHRPDYTSYTPTQEDLLVIRKSLDALPPSFKKALSQRVVGLYFVNNFQGNGFTEWLRDKKGKKYFFMAFNPRTLKKNISELLTEKESSCFMPESTPLNSTMIYIDGGTDQKAFVAILLHETAHVIDGLNRITKTSELGPPENGVMYNPYKYKLFNYSVWDSAKTPVNIYNLPQRELLAFYGSNGGPKISITQAPELYYELKTTPFASLYGSQTSGEDFAELLMFYHLTQKLRQPYKITVIENGRKVVEYEPMKNPLVMERFFFLEQFYRE